MRLFLISLALLISGCDLFPQSHLQRVQEKGILQVLTRNSATTYYEGPFGPTGLEYDLAAGFAEFLGVRLRIETPDTLSRILVEIQGGNADLAAAGLTVTEERKAYINFGPSYQRITPQLVYRVGTASPRNLDELNGNLEVVAKSSHAERLTSLQDEYPNLTFEENSELESQQLLDLVWEQLVDYTVADSNEVAIIRRFYPELRVAFDISTPVPLAWAFPPGEDRSLIDKAEEYFSNAYNLEPQNPWRINQLAYHLINYDIDINEGMELIEKGLEQYSEDAGLLQVKGWGFTSRVSWKNQSNF